LQKSGERVFRFARHDPDRGDRWECGRRDRQGTFARPQSGCRGTFAAAGAAWTDELLRWSEISDVARFGRALDTGPLASFAFNGNANFGIVPDKDCAIGAADVTIHF